MTAILILAWVVGAHVLGFLSGSFVHVMTKEEVGPGLTVLTGAIALALWWASVACAIGFWEMVR